MLSFLKLYSHVQIFKKFPAKEIKDFINIYLPMNLLKVIHSEAAKSGGMFCCYRPTLRLTWWPGMGITHRTSTT